MNKTIPSMMLGLAFALLTGLALATGPAFAEEHGHTAITQELIALLGRSHEVRDLLEQSIAEARKVSPDPKANPVQSLPDYYDFVDRASQLLPQDILKEPAFTVRDQMLQGICYFYFLVDQPLQELEHMGLFRNRIQYYPPFSSWLRGFADSWGAYLDTDASWSEAIYQQIFADPAFGLQAGWYESPSHWKTFNQFFARHLKSPAVRPIADPDDPAVVTAPADSVPRGVWPIDQDSKIRVEGGIKVKLLTYYSIEELLGKESQYKDAFANGVLTHTFLNVNDYHRYHFAVSGTVKEMNIIQENVALEVTWDPKVRKYVPIDSTGWQFTQTRGYVIVDTQEHGLVALIPMGMAQVSSVNFEPDVEVGSSHEKGDMLGNFLFGGSDFIMLFQEQAGFELTAEKATADYRHMLMGEAYGIMNGSANKE
jgi:phosphatidylserine decarboxylase